MGGGSQNDDENVENNESRWRVEIGNYTVTVQVAGFRTQEQKGIMVQLQQKARVDFVLVVGDTKESVTVTATGVELKTDDAVVGQVIDNRRVIDHQLTAATSACWRS